MGSNVSAVPIAAGVISDSPVVLAGVMIRNTHGANAGVFRIYDHASSATGTILFSANLAAGINDNIIFPGNGVQAFKGLFLDITGSATVEGSVLIA